MFPLVKKKIPGSTAASTSFKVSKVLKDRLKQYARHRLVEVGLPDFPEGLEFNLVEQLEGGYSVEWKNSKGTTLELRNIRMSANLEGRLSWPVGDAGFSIHERKPTKVPKSC